MSRAGLIRAGAPILLSVALAQPLSAQGPADPTRFVLDLAGPSERPPVTIPEDQSLDVWLENVVPTAAYRITKQEGRPPNRRTRIIELPAVPLFAVNPSAQCTGLGPAIDAVKAAQDEAEVAARVKDLEGVLATRNCTTPDKQAVGLIRMGVQRALRESQRLATNEELVLTVERVGQGPAARRWTFTFRGRAADQGWIYPTEQAWVVAMVSEGLTRMSFRAASVPRGGEKVAVTSGAAPGQFVVAIPLPGRPLSVTLTPATHVWDPAVYGPLVRGLRDALPAKAARGPKAPPGPDALDALLDLRAPVLEGESRRVSARLRDDVLDAGAHEEAALVLGAFALREAARDFSDVRLIAARACAHLAFAKGLRGDGPPSRSGRWAAILISTLVGRQREAVEALPKLPGPQGSELAWARALRLRNGQDWRGLAPAPAASLLEKLAYFRAVTEALSASQALLALPDSKLEAVPDWGRVVADNPYSVEEGNRFLPSAVATEMAELGGVLGLADEAVLQALSAPPPAGGDSLEVLGRQAWIESAARHLSADLVSVDQFLRRSLGLPEQADEFLRQTEKVGAGLPLYPLVRRRRQDKGQTEIEQSLCVPLRQMAKASPERLTAANWDLAHRSCAGTGGFPGPGAWFQPAVPNGTVLDARARMLVLELNASLTPAQTQQWRELSPFDAGLRVDALQRQYHGKVPLEVVDKEFGLLAQYHFRAMKFVLDAYRKEPGADRAMAERICALSADHCDLLGAALLAAGLDEQAARAYQRLMDHGLDRVGASHRSAWLVTYYQDHGEAAKALAVATQAAETHSSTGLNVMARLLERLGRYQEAESWYRRLQERYGDESELLNFYLRTSRRPGGERYAEQAQKARAKLFPRGLEAVSLAALGTARVPGPTLTFPSDGLVKQGITAGDTVVALDGYRVRDQNEYGSVKALRDDPLMRLIIWHGNRYVEIEERRERINHFAR